MLTLLLFLSPLLSLSAHTDAQTPQSSGVQNELVNSNVSSATRIVSLVDNVTVTKFSILSPHRLNVDLIFWKR